MRNFTIRLADQDLRQLAAKARQADSSVSNYARKLVTDALASEHNEDICNQLKTMTQWFEYIALTALQNFQLTLDALSHTGVISGETDLVVKVSCNKARATLRDFKEDLQSP